MSVFIAFFQSDLSRAASLARGKLNKYRKYLLSFLLPIKELEKS